MKKIVCDLCESTEFTKEGGFFICQGCGTKYSLEEAKAMMREVEGSAPVSAGVPVTAVPMGNPNKTLSGFWEDNTRLPEYYDGTYQYLKSLGIEEI